MVSETELVSHLKQILYPGSHHDIVALGLIHHVRVEEGRVLLRLRPSSASEEILTLLTGKINTLLKEMSGVKRVEIQGEAVRGDTVHAPRSPVSSQNPLPGVRKIIAVASGKGGVGKSTVAVNLVLALKDLGNRVGLLDADVHGPSVPLMMGTEAAPRTASGKKIYPVERYGINLISMGFFLDDESPVIWRGPIVMGIIRQFLRDVIWGELDYLVVDLPPGTGDASLTLAQEVPLDGGVIVSTPQDVALLDVQRGIAMFRQVKVPIFGIIENMSYYICPHCGERDDIFGHGGVSKTGLEMLGEVPIVEEIRAAGDNGRPLVFQHPDHPIAQVFRRIASRVIEISQEKISAL